MRLLRWEVSWVLGCVLVGLTLRLRSGNSNSGHKRGSPSLPPAATLSPPSPASAPPADVAFLDRDGRAQTGVAPDRRNAGSATTAVATPQPEPLYPRATRPSRVRAALPDLFSLAPAPDGYLPSFRNPCWRGRYWEKDGKGPGVEANESLLCLPGFYVIGHVKAGTSDLWQFISKHPNVNPGRVLKEQHYFTRPWISAAQFVHRYRRFANAVGGPDGRREDRESIAGDATPDLIWAHLRHLNVPFPHVNVTVAEVLAELHPKARLVLSLREPASRLWSDFFYFAHRPNMDRDIDIPHPDSSVNEQHFDAFARLAAGKMERCMRANGGDARACTFQLRTGRRMHASNVRFAMGCYGPFVQEYLAHFSAGQLLVVTLDEYKAAPKATLTRVFRHLGVHDPTEPEWAHILGRRKVTNQQGDHYKKLRMLNSTRVALREAYAPCLEHLDRVMGVDRFARAWGGRGGGGAKP